MKVYNYLAKHVDTIFTLCILYCLVFIGAMLIHILS